jgi:hypothetical protein
MKLTTFIIAMENIKVLPLGKVKLGAEGPKVVK